MLKRSLTALATLLLAGPAAGEWDLAGFAGVDTRAFWHDSRYPEPEDGLNLSLLVQPEAYWQSGEGDMRFSFVGFARADQNDSERSHADIRELAFGIDGDGWDLTAGISKVFWGVTESRHLVDVINQADLVEDIDQEDKLGQPMVNFNLDRDYGRFEFFVLPWFRERTFAGADGRFRLPLPVDTDNPVWESGDEERHVDYAFRYSHYFGDVDIGLHVFDGTSREPGLALAPEGDRLLPVYEQMTQVGVDLQYTRDAWLWKLEAIQRDATSDSFFAAVGGFEYTFYGVRDSDADVGLLVEYLYDGRNEFAPPITLDNDLFIGSRLALNDAEDTSVLAGFAMDLDTQEYFINVEAERRLNDSLSTELRIRAFLNSAPGQQLNLFERDDYVQLRVNWYF